MTYLSRRLYFFASRAAAAKYLEPLPDPILGEEEGRVRENRALVGPCYAMPWHGWHEK
jgi:hypothetical protein